MFVITINKRKLTKIAAIALCAIATGAAVIGLNSFFRKDETVFSASKGIKFTTTEQMVEYISQKGHSADIQTAKVAEVEIPKKFDDNFKAFNEKIKQTDGLSLEKYKGDKVNKWTFNIIEYKQSDVRASAVLLVKKDKLIGAYILEHPDGIAKPMVSS